MPRKVETRRDRIVDTLSKVLTSPDNALSSEDLYHFTFVANNFGVAEKIETFLSEFKPEDLKQEIVASMLVYALNRTLR
jgi:hypothetical protein